MTIVVEKEALPLSRCVCNALEASSDQQNNLKIIKLMSKKNCVRPPREIPLNGVGSEAGTRGTPGCETHSRKAVIEQRSFVQ